MSNTKTIAEEIKLVKAEIEQLNQQKKMLAQQQKELEHKARTNRLIERGAMLESFIDDDGSLSNEQVRALLEKVVTTINARNIINRIKSQKQED